MDIKYSKKVLREFGILIGLIFPFIIGFLLPFLRGHSFNFWTLYISFPLIFLGLIKPNVLIYPYEIWMKLGLILGFVNSRIILGLVYFLVLIPISFFMKLFGYDPLLIKKNNKKSYSIRNNRPSVNFHKIF